jgi:putative transposase
MYRAVGVVLEPTVGQSVRLERLVDLQRELYNAALEERRGAWRWERRRVTKYEQYRELTGFGEVTGTYGVTVCRGTLNRLDEAFKGFFRRIRSGARAGFPRFKGRGRFRSLSWPDGSGWKLDKSNGEHSGRLYLQGVGPLRVVGSRKIPPGVGKTLTVCRRGRRWEATVFVEIERPPPRAATGRAVGIDVGVVSLATTSDGEHVANPAAYHTIQAELGAAQADMARRRRGSWRWRQAKQRIDRAHRKAAAIRKDQAHQISRRLVDAYDLICHEDLAVTNMVRRPAPRPDGQGGFALNGAAAKAGLNRSISDAAWGQLLSFLAYKAEEAGRQVIRVDPRHTSTTCPGCRYRDKANRPSQATFRCTQCGYAGNADQVAATNILRAGLAQRASAKSETTAA